MSPRLGVILGAEFVTLALFDFTDNAIKSSSKGSAVKFVVKIEAGAAGIPVDQRTHLFEALACTPGYGRAAFGIGLPILQAIDEPGSLSVLRIDDDGEPCTKLAALPYREPDGRDHRREALISCAQRKVKYKAASRFTPNSDDGRGYGFSAQAQHV